MSFMWMPSVEPFECGLKFGGQDGRPGAVLESGRIRRTVQMRGKYSRYKRVTSILMRLLSCVFECGQARLIQSASPIVFSITERNSRMRKGFLYEWRTDSAHPAPGVGLFLKLPDYKSGGLLHPAA
jgi:hypothetical protein